MQRPTARTAAAAPPRIERSPDVVSAFLNDAAHVAGGFAAGVTFPRHEAEAAAAVAAADRVLAVGAQSSLTGGATPRGDLVLSTRALTAIGTPVDGCVRVGAGVRLAELQRRLAETGFYYPPVPTFDGASVGGTIATNAAGAATFKYGSTRDWVEGLTVVTAGGEVLEIPRDTIRAGDDRTLRIPAAGGGTIGVPVPRYTMPRVAKLSAGYYARAGMDLVDLFVGSEGTLGVVVSATLRVIPRPRRSVALVACRDDAQALALVEVLRTEARRAWHGGGPLDVAAVEYMDARSLAVVPDDAFGRARVARPTGDAVFLLLQIEVGAAEDAALERLAEMLSSHDVTDDPLVAGPDDEGGAMRLFELREAVPASVNARVAAAKARVDARVEKAAGDMIVPFDRLGESIALYRRAFEDRGLEYAIWGHASDGNLHPNVIPHSFADVERGREAIREIAAGVIEMGGAPLAEHGVGRSALKQQLLRDLYGDEGIDDMRAVKRALDPAWKLAPGVLFSPPA